MFKSLLLSAAYHLPRTNANSIFFMKGIIEAKLSLGAYRCLFDPLMTGKNSLPKIKNIWVFRLSQFTSSYFHQVSVNDQLEKDNELGSCCIGLMLNPAKCQNNEGTHINIYIIHASINLSITQLSSYQNTEVY